MNIDHSQEQNIKHTKDFPIIYKFPSRPKFKLKQPFELNSEKSINKLPLSVNPGQISRPRRI